jgi:hypothetical protein
LGPKLRFHFGRQVLGYLAEHLCKSHFVEFNHFPFVLSFKRELKDSFCRLVLQSEGKELKEGRNV